METNAEGFTGYRFYNAGVRIDEQWPFSISPTSPGFNPGDGQVGHSVGKFNFIAPKQGWVFVPLEIKTGQEVVRVNFVDDAKRKYGRRGVVMLDPRWDPAKESEDKPLETYPVAPTEALVIERAEKLWDVYLDGICSAHFEDVQNAMANGMRPRGAAGFTLNALRLKGYKDPAQEFLRGMREGRQGNGVPSSSPEMVGVLKGIQEQNSLLTRLILSIATGQKIDPELLKAAMSPDAPAPKPHGPAMQPPINTGTLEVDGQPSSSLEARINRRTVETVYDPPTARPKQERAKAAAKEL